MILMTTLTPAKKPESKLETTNLLRTSFLRHFGILNDPRIDRTKEHLLIDIVAIAILAVISGAEGWVAIETYGSS